MNTTFTRSLFWLVFYTFISVGSPLKAAEDDFAGLHCPGDVWVSCNAELWDLSIYGNAYFATYDGNISAGNPLVSYNLNSCNVGTITRTWSMYMYGSHYSCSQVIYVESSGGFGLNNISWPTEHVELIGCNPSTAPDDLPYGAQRPHYTYSECSLIAISYTDMTFNFGSSCEKVLRTWKILDWCTYSPNNGSNAGLYTYVQVIKINKGDEPQTICQADISVSSYNCQDTYVSAPPLYLGDNGCGGSYDITNDSPYAVAHGADVSGTYPVGVTPVRYTITYGCGLKKHCYTNVVVNDISSPHAYCIGQIIMPLMGIDTDGDGVNDEGMAQIWAKDFDHGSFSPCGHGPLTFSFSPYELIMSKTFTCDHVGINNVYVYIKDALGNQSSCQVEVNIQNNNANIQDCEAEEVVELEPEDHTVYLMGRVEDAYGNMLSSVVIENMMTMIDTVIIETVDTTINITSDSVLNASGTWLYYEIHDTIFDGTIDTLLLPIHDGNTMSTNNEGMFIFDNLSMYMDYSVTPLEHSFNGKEAITYEDIWVLLYHVLGYEQITDPLKLIAADVDADGSITRNDLVALIDYVKGDIYELPAEQNWIILNQKFVDEVGAESLLTLDQYPSSISMKELDSNFEDLNFLAIQLGNLTNISNIKNKNNNMNAILEQLEDPASVLNASSLQVAYRKDVNIENVQVYPNPFNDEFQIAILNETSQYADVKLMDAAGRSWISKRLFLDQGYQVINMDAKLNLPSGLYLYQIQLGSQTIQGRLVKN